MQRSAERWTASRSVLRVACAVALLVVGMVAPGEARAEDSSLLGNVTIAVESHPKTVTAGSKVIYRVTLTHQGVATVGDPPVDIEVTSTLLPGGKLTGYTEPCQEPKVSATTCTVIVDGPLVAGSSVSFDLLGADLPVGETRIKSTIGTIVAGNDPNDDTATASTTVISGTDTAACTYQNIPLDGATGCKRGFFEGGSTVAFGAQRLTVPEGNGVIGELAEVGADSHFCETHSCRYGVGVLENFERVPGFEVTDPRNPLQTFITSRKGDPCRGLGNEGCLLLLTLRYESEGAGGWKLPESDDPEIPLCIGSNTIPDNVLAGTVRACIADRSRTTAAGVRFRVLSLSDDPGMY